MTTLSRQYSLPLIIIVTATPRVERCSKFILFKFKKYIYIYIFSGCRYVSEETPWSQEKWLTWWFRGVLIPGANDQPRWPVNIRLNDAFVNKHAFTPFLISNSCRPAWVYVRRAKPATKPRFEIVKMRRLASMNSQGRQYRWKEYPASFPGKKLWKRSWRIPRDIECRLERLCLQTQSVYTVYSERRCYMLDTSLLNLGSMFSLLVYLH